MPLNRPSQEVGDKLCDIGLDLGLGQAQDLEEQNNNLGGGTVREVHSSTTNRTVVVDNDDEVDDDDDDDEEEELRVQAVPTVGSREERSAALFIPLEIAVGDQAQCSHEEGGIHTEGNTSTSNKSEDEAGSSLEPQTPAALSPCRLRQPSPNARSIAVNASQDNIPNASSIAAAHASLSQQLCGTRLGHSSNHIQTSPTSEFHDDHGIHVNQSEGAASTSRQSLPHLQNMSHSQLTSLNRRRSTFHDWPSNHIIRPEDIALAGMYYQGIGDLCKCPFCGGSLRDWEPTDDPMIEHARWFPRCRYVNQTMGKSFVDAVQELEMNGRQNITRSEVEERLNRNGIFVTREQSSGQDLPLPGEALALFCRVCGIRRVRILCLPCCHLVCCIQCSELLTGCSVEQNRYPTKLAMCPECSRVIKTLKMVAIRSRIEYPRVF